MVADCAQVIASTEAAWRADESQFACMIVLLTAAVRTGTAAVWQSTIANAHCFCQKRMATETVQAKVSCQWSGCTFPTTSHSTDKLHSSIAGGFVHAMLLFHHLRLVQTLCSMLLFLRRGPRGQGMSTTFYLELLQLHFCGGRRCICAIFTSCACRRPASWPAATRDGNGHGYDLLVIALQQKRQMDVPAVTADKSQLLPTPGHKLRQNAFTTCCACQGPSFLPAAI